VMPGFKAIALTALFGASLALSPIARTQTQQTTVPDAPAPPQAAPPLTGDGPITPAKAPRVRPRSK